MAAGQPPSVAQACPAIVGEINVPFLISTIDKHQVSSDSNANSSSLVATIFRQIVTELNGAESKEMGKWLLGSIGGK
jgi:hypothetical protein